VLLHRHRVTDCLDLCHLLLEPSRHRGHRKRVTHHTGRLQHPPPGQGQGFDAAQQQLPQAGGQAVYRGVVTQRPLSRLSPHQPLLHEMLHQGHHEQGVAVGARKCAITG